MFVYFLEPLKNETIHYNYPFYYNILAVLTFFSSIAFFTFIVPLLFPRFFSQSTWSFNRFLLWFFGMCISTAYVSYLLDAWIYQLPFSSNVFFEYIFSYQIFIDIFIAISMFLFFLYQYSPNQQPQLDNIPSLIEPINDELFINNVILPETNTGNQTLRLNTQNERNNIDIAIEHFYYITSANNYVEIFYEKENGNLNRLLLRSTLKNIEEQNQNLPMLFRCHKAFIVNVQKIKSIKGNTKGYSLILENVNEHIPVSRQKNEELEKRFPHLL